MIAVLCYTSNWKGHCAEICAQGISTFVLSLLSAYNTGPGRSFLQCETLSGLKIEHCKVLLGQ